MAKLPRIIKYFKNMGQYTSYYLYQKFEKIGEQDYIPVYPNVYSIDADGTMPTVVKEEEDVNCGYVPPFEPLYRWVQLTPTSDPSTYVCDDCQVVPKYRWVQLTPTSDPDSYTCEECQVAPLYRWVQLTPTSDPDSYICDECVQT